MEQVETFHEATPTEIMELLPPPVSEFRNNMNLMGMEVVFYVHDEYKTITHGIVTNRDKYFTFNLGLDSDGALIIVPDRWKWIPNDPTI